MAGLPEGLINPGSSSTRPFREEEFAYLGIQIPNSNS